MPKINQEEYTEVKNMKWFKKELDNIENNTPALHRHDAIWMLNKVHELYDQLDEPETLSQAWIDQNHFETENWDEDLFKSDGETIDHTPQIKVIALQDLQKQNLLIPKQELPVIPKFVAEWIEDYVESGFDLYPALKKMENNSRAWGEKYETYDWYRKNTHKFVNAYLTGRYEVEEEQKYYVDLETAAYVAKWDGNGSVQIYTDGISGSDEYELHLTEQEIKDYDERFWPFAVKVEEVE